MDYTKTIYKKDSTGKIRILTVSTEGSTLSQESGLLDGARVIHTSVSVGKNIGRSNETTPKSQAIIEAKAKIVDKLTHGYFLTIEEAQKEEVILPMLAKDFKKESHKVVYPCYAQPKLDGMRILGARETPMISRDGKTITTLDHIQKELDSLIAINILDGEGYSHGVSFQENMKLIKKYRAGETEKVKYHVYDMVLSGSPFIDRYKFLLGLVKDLKYIELVPTVIINNINELKMYHQKNLSEGYEGTIIRHSDAGYGINKRDSQLLKYKDFIDEAYEVVDVLPSDKNPEQGVIHCKLSDGRTFGCGMKFSHTEREEILINKSNYIGKIAEIRFFEFSDEGIPRFPVCHGFRLDK